MNRIPAQHHFGFKNLETRDKGSYLNAEHFLLIKISGGKGWLEADAELFALAQDKLYLLNPGTLYKLTDDKPLLKGFIIYFTIDFVRFGEGEFDIDLLRLFSQPDREPSIQLQPLQLQSLERVLNLFREELAEKPMNLMIVKALLHLLLAKLMTYQHSSLLRPSINKQRILDFFNLLQVHYLQERNAGFYADKLHISTKRLNQVLQEATGKTAMQLLHYMLVLEAKRYLVLGKYSVKEIAHLLGFEDRSYFSLFFKRNTGLAPELFKKKLSAALFAKHL